MEDFDTIIIGAGVVGLSIAYFLSNLSNNILVIEKNRSFGMETSSRNSEVIHSGIYYPENSYKAKLCVRGRRLLYEFCDKYDVRYIRTGKLIVAIDKEEEELIKELFSRGIRNEVEGLELLDKKEILKMVPNVKAISAIHSKETGVFDSHTFMKRLYSLAKDKQVIFAFNKEVTNISMEGGYYKIFCSDGDYITSKIVINAGGLYSDKIAQMVGLDIDLLGYRLKYYKGDYFYYSKKIPIKKLIYPVPHIGLQHLGVHLTIDVDGRIKFGPDAYYIDRISYEVDASKRDIFFEKASRILDNLDKEAFMPDTSGIRPKLSGVKFRDFVVTEENNNGFPGFFNLIGIESPGLTSSLAIGEYIANVYREQYL